MTSPPAALIAATVILLCSFPAASAATCGITDAKFEVTDDGRCGAVAVQISNRQTPWTATPTFFVAAISVTAAGSARGGISNLQLNCGNFRSYSVSPPQIFRRTPEGYCLVRNGGFIKNGEVITFYYQQSVCQPLSVKHYDC